MKRLLLSVSFILCGKLLVAQPYAVDFTKLVNKTHTERTLALFDYYGVFIRDQDSTRVFEDIEWVRKLASAHKDDGLMVEADLIEAHYYAYRYDGRAQELPMKLLPLMQHAKKFGNPIWFRARMESLIGTRMNENQNYELAFRHLKKAVDLLENESSEAYPIKNICLFLLADLHYQFREYRPSLALLQKTAAHPSAKDRHYYTMKVLNMMALCYRNLDLLDSSNYWLQKTYDLAIATNDTVWQTITLGNLGENYYLKKDYDQAEPLLIIDAESSEQRGGFGPASNALTLLGDIYLTWGQIEKADQTLTKALDFAHRSRQYKRLTRVFPVLVNLYATQGKQDLVKIYLDSTFIAKDSVARVFDQMVLSRAEQKLEREQLEAETQIVEERLQRQVLLRNGTIISLLLILMVVMLLVSRRRLKTKQHEQQQETARLKAENELGKAQLQLQEFVRAVQEKNEQIEESEAELSRLREGQDEHRQQAIKALENAVILTDGDWREFVRLFELAHPHFFEHLAQRLPDLSEAETRFLTLTRLGLSGKEMAAMLGVSLEAIRQMRLRIRRKPDVGEDVDLIQLVMDL